jgi:hypothetical protein
MRLFNEMTKLQAQQGQIIITQAQMLAELKELVAAQYLQLNNRVDQVERDVAPLSWVKWVTLVIGGVLIAQAVANIFN